MINQRELRLGIADAILSAIHEHIISSGITFNQYLIHRYNFFPAKSKVIERLWVRNPSLLVAVHQVNRSQSLSLDQCCVIA